MAPELTLVYQSVSGQEPTCLLPASQSPALRDSLLDHSRLEQSRVHHQWRRQTMDKIGRESWVRWGGSHG